MADDDILKKIEAAASLPSEPSIRFLLRTMTGDGVRWEVPSVDFKEDFDGESRAWLTLLAEGAALTNSGGGVLVFGVRNDGSRIGVSNLQTADLDSARINDRLGKYLSGLQFNVSTVETKYYRNRFVGLFFRPVEGIVVFDKVGNDTQAGTTKSVFTTGVVYVRRGSSKAPATQAEINRIIRRLADNQAREFVSRVERVAFLPAGAQLIAESATNPGSGARLTGQNLGNAVSINSLDNGQPSGIAEILNPAVPFSSFGSQVAQQVRQWKHEDPRFRVPRSTLSLWLKRRHEIDWIEDSCELALLSSVRNKSLPNWWARQIPLAKLESIVRRLIDEFTFPDRKALPNLICSHLWEKREELFKDLKSGREQNQIPQRWVLNELLALSKVDFLNRGRSASITCTFNGTDYRISEVERNRESYETLFTQMVHADDTGGEIDRSFLEQLDIRLYARV